ncbi:MAG: hypothetical protein AAF580_00020 [Pseudomonadota bacterium]
MIGDDFHFAAGEMDAGLGEGGAQEVIGFTAQDELRLRVALGLHPNDER